jgi:hypothetical protein
MEEYIFPPLLQTAKTVRHTLSNQATRAEKVREQIDQFRQRMLRQKLAAAGLKYL